MQPLTPRLDGVQNGENFTIMASLSKHPAPVNAKVRIKDGRRTALKQAIQLCF